MKKLLFTPVILLSCALFMNVRAQTAKPMTPKEMEKHEKEVQKSRDKNDVIWDWDTVYKSGVPYCIIYEVEKGAFHHNDYSVRNLQQQELIYVKYDTYTDYNAPRQPNTAPPVYGYYHYIFTDTKAEAELLMNRPFKEIVDNNLIDNAATLDANAESMFVAKYPKKYSLIAPPQVIVVAPPAPAPPPLPNYTPVPRNRGGMLQIIGNDVNQDGRSIGSVQYNEVITNGMVYKTMNVFLPNGVKVAQATCQGGPNHNWTVLTMKDNVQGYVNSMMGQDNMDVVKYLINGFYL